MILSRQVPSLVEASSTKFPLRMVVTGATQPPIPQREEPFRSQGKMTLICIQNYIFSVMLWHFTQWSR